MSLDIVGRENLPNVYIKEIAIDRFDDYRLLTNCTVYIKDLKDGSSRFQWYDNHDLRKTMKIMIVASSSTKFNENIRLARYENGFVPQHLKTIEGYDPNTVQHQVIAIQTLNKKRLAECAEIVSGGILYTFAYKRKFVIKSKYNLSIFAVCFVDTQQFSVEENIDLSYSQINSFHGAIAGEEVLKNGVAQNKTNLFFYGKNLWTGPTHFHHEKGFMAGSKHSSRSHPPLKRLQLQNTKVKDYRFFFKRKPRINRVVAQKTPFIGSLHESYNNKGNFTGTFSLNMKQFFIQRTRYGDLLLQLNEDLFNSMLSKVKIHQLSVIRENILLSRTTGKSGTTKPVPRKAIKTDMIITTHDNRPYSLRTRYRYFNTKTGRNRDLFSRTSSKNISEEKLKSVIKEVHNENSLIMRNFVFSDLDVSYKTSGYHRYALKLEFRDPTYDYVKEMLKNLKSGFIQYKMYKEKVALRINYDYALDKTKERFVELQQDNSWIKMIDVFLKYYDLLFDAEEEDIRTLGQQLISLVNPRSATLKSMNIFYQQYQFLLNYFMKFFNVSDDLFNEPNTRGNVRINPDQGKIKIDYKFDNILRFNEKIFRLSFLPKNFHSQVRDPGTFPTVSKGEWFKHSSGERNKYFKSSPKFTEKNIPLLDSDATRALNSLAEYYCTYFSPRTLAVEDNIMDLSVIEKIDLFDFNKFFGKFIKAPSNSSTMFTAIPRREAEIINRARSSFHIKKPTILTKNENSIKVKDVPTTNILGSNSGMALSQNVKVKLGNNVVDNKIKNVFSTFESSKAIQERKQVTDYVMDGQQNIIMNMISSKGFNPSLLERIPLQVKALLGSKQDFSRTNILSSEMDLLASPLTKDLSSMLFFVITEVQYLFGYKQGRNGEVNIKKPIWKTLTKTALDSLRVSTLCRLRFYTNKNLNIDTPIQTNYNIENQYFYLGAGGVRDNLSVVNPLEQQRGSLLSTSYGTMEQANQHPAEYASSILITQPDNKNGPLKSIDYGVQKAEVEANNDFMGPAGNTTTSTMSSSPSGGSY